MESQGPREKTQVIFILEQKMFFTYFIASVSDYGLLAFQYS